MIKNITPKEFNKIIALFKKKGWAIDNSNKSSLYKKFINRYSLLKTPQQKEAFLNLAEQYHVVDLEEYMELIIKILNTIFIDDKREDILIFPLLKYEDINKIKSSVFLSYLFKHTELCYHDNIYKKQFTIVDDYDMLKAKLNKNKILFLVDDYIGSGVQSLGAIKCIFDFINSSCKLDVEDVKQIYIISLYMHEKGESNLKEEIKNKSNVELYYGIKRRYSIANYESILGQIDIKDGNKTKTFKGYNDCGDLVTLIRTPNNTIPLFRHTTKAPFPRRS